MIIGLIGYARSGKDTVANILVERYGFVRMAFADGVRDMAMALDPFVQVDGDRHYTEGNTPFARYSTMLKTIGYDAAKSHPDVRRLLQRLGTEAVRNVLGENAWIDIVAKRIHESANQNVVLTDVRFENEAAFVAGSGGVIVRLVRPGFGRETGHPSETEMESWSEDARIVAESLDELNTKVCELMESERLPDIRLVQVERIGDNVVESATGRVLATKLGTVDSEVVQTPVQAEAAASVIDDVREAQMFTATLHTATDVADDGVQPNKLGVLTGVVEESIGGEHDVVEQAITEVLTGDIVE